MSGVNCNFYCVLLPQLIPHNDWGYHGYVNFETGWYLVLISYLTELTGEKTRKRVPTYSFTPSVIESNVWVKIRTFKIYNER